MTVSTSGVNRLARKEYIMVYMIPIVIYQFQFKRLDIKEIDAAFAISKALYSSI